MKKTLIRSLLAFSLLFLAPKELSAVTQGVLDGDAHPYVGLMLFEVDGEPAWRCSGALISPTVMVTAGHCTYGATGGRVWFEADVESGIPDNGYPFGGETSVEFAELHTHPDYLDAAFWLHDVGVVILAKPVYLERYATLPELDQLDVLKRRRGRQNVTFTSVGYGLQRINPVFLEAERIRMKAYPRLIQINTPGFTGDYSLLVSNNHDTGGTCFGDSGGPNLLHGTDTIAAVTSFVLNGNCAGTGGVFRLDRLDVLVFIHSFLSD